MPMKFKTDPKEIEYMVGMDPTIDILAISKNLGYKRRSMLRKFEADKFVPSGSKKYDTIVPNYTMDKRLGVRRSSAEAILQHEKSSTADSLATS